MFRDTRPQPHYSGQDGSAGAFQQFLALCPSSAPFPTRFPLGKDPGQEADWSQPGEGTQNTTKGRCCEQAVPKDPRWEQGLESEELTVPRVEESPEPKHSDSTGARLRNPPETPGPCKEGFLQFMV